MPAQCRTYDADDFCVLTELETTGNLVEYWRWRYRDPETGHIYRTAFQMSVEKRRLVTRCYLGPLRYARGVVSPNEGSSTSMTSRVPSTRSEFG